MLERGHTFREGLARRIRYEKDMLFFSHSLQRQGERLQTLAHHAGKLDRLQIEGEPPITVHSANFLRQEYLYSFTTVDDTLEIDECYLNGFYKNATDTIFPVMSYVVYKGSRRVVNEEKHSRRVLANGDVLYSINFEFDYGDTGKLKPRVTSISSRAMRSELLTNVGQLDQRHVLSSGDVLRIFRERATP